MKYRLNVDKDGRVLSATFDKYGSSDMPLVEALPDGDVSQYRYVDGAFVLDPVEVPELPVPTTLDERVAELEEALELILSGVVE